MAKKITEVELQAKSNEELKKSFSLPVAEKILSMKNGGGWQLPDNSDFEYSENGIKRRKDKGTSEGA